MNCYHLYYIHYQVDEGFRNSVLDCLILPNVEKMKSKLLYISVLL